MENMKNRKIIIAGGTGFIGQALAARWARDNQVVILSRQSAKTQNNSYNHKLLTAEDGYRITYWHWDGRFVEKHWAHEIEGADLVLNLAGRSVNCRYTPQNKQEIFDSRTDATRTIGQAIREATVPPKLWINAASATIYRHAQDRPQDEYTGEYHDDFSVLVCKRWEKTFEEQRTPFTRKIAMRMAVTNSFFMSTLRRLTGHRIGLPAPAWLLKLGAAIIGTEAELLLKSRWVAPTKLLETGFSFQYSRLDAALRSIIRKLPQRKYRLF